jgi:hypothetical protein
MTIEQLNKNLETLELQYEEQKRTLIKEYCLANNPYKVGDVFTDHLGSILIDNIKVYIYDKCCIYYGVELTKKGEQNKRGTTRSALQTNDINN